MSAADPRAPVPARDEHLRRHRQRARAAPPAAVARAAGARSSRSASATRCRTTPTSCSAAAARTPRRARSAPTSPPRGAELRAMADDGVVMLTICGTLPDARPRVRHPGRRAHRRASACSTSITRGQARAADRQQLRRHPGRRPAGRLREPQRADRTRHRASRPLGTHRRPDAATTARDRTEGAVRDNVIGTYLHGPVLAKSAALRRRPAAPGAAPPRAGRRRSNRSTTRWPTARRRSPSAVPAEQLLAADPVSGPAAESDGSGSVPGSPGRPDPVSAVGDAYGSLRRALLVAHR